MTGLLAVVGAVEVVGTLSEVCGHWLTEGNIDEQSSSAVDCDSTGGVIVLLLVAS